MTTTTRVMIDAQGGPEVMRLEAFDVPPPGPGEAQIEQTAIGLNYMDVYQRSGMYPMKLPSPMGLEAAGRVVAVGDGVTEVAVGDRVVYSSILGAYAGVRNAPAARLIHIPDGISDDEAAAVTKDKMLCVCNDKTTQTMARISENSRFMVDQSMLLLAGWQTKK